MEDRFKYFRCRTQEEFIWILKILRRQGYLWTGTGKINLEKNLKLWNEYGELTILYVDKRDGLVSFGNVNGEKGNDVIEVDYLMAKVEI